MNKKPITTIRFGYLLMIFFMVSQLIPVSGYAQSGDRYQGPIIDMHLHAYTNADYPGSIPGPADGKLSPATAEEHMHRTIEAMRQYKVVMAAVSGEFLLSAENWYNYDPDRVLKAIVLGDPADFMSAEQFSELAQENQIHILGELIGQYVGYSPSDPVYAPYFKIAEEHGIPVGIHTGASFPGVHHMGYPKFRLSLGDPLLLEDLLVEYPRLKVYMMHAGGQYYNHAIDMMTMYPNLYTDISLLNWMPGWTQEVLELFLKEAQKRGLLDRVLFGSDQMFWPQAIGMAIGHVNSFDFLTLEEKKGIFYSNAARFLGLSDEEIARHHE